MHHAHIECVYVLVFLLPLIMHYSYHTILSGTPDPRPWFEADDTHVSSPAPLSSFRYSGFNSACDGGSSCASVPIYWNLQP